MSDKNLQQRAQIDAAYKWDIEAMYPRKRREKDLTEAVKAAEAFTRYSGHLTDLRYLYEALTEKGRHLAQAGARLCLCRDAQR